jgi:adhesin HecA-like repeat protein
VRDDADGLQFLPVSRQELELRARGLDHDGGLLGAADPLLLSRRLQRPQDLVPRAEQPLPLLAWISF